MPSDIDFFYGCGSRYSYLASNRIDWLESQTGRKVGWRPLYSGDLMKRRGVSPFEGSPVSGQYDWSYRQYDAECWAEYYGVPFREPKDVEVDHGRLAYAATAGARLGAVEAMSRRLMRAVYVDGITPLDDDAYCRLAVEVGLDADDYRAALDDPATAADVQATVEEAHTRGVFGVPTFFVDGRMFWGNDRLTLVRHFALKGNGS